MPTLVASEGLAQLCVSSSRSAVFGFWFISPGKCLVPKCLLPGAAQLEREIVRQVLPRAALGCKVRAVSRRSPAQQSFDDLLASVLHAASLFIFFLRFLRFFLFFVGASAESLPEALAVDWTAILLCFGPTPPVIGAAL